MTVVADVSPGTVLVAGATGWRYTVTGGDDDTVVARGRGVCSASPAPNSSETSPRGAIEVCG